MTGNHKRAFQCCCILLCGMLLSGCNSVHWGREYTCDAPAEPGALTSPSEGNWLRVVSWNLHGTPEVAPMQRRLERVAAQVLARKPDIALFQEVWFEGDAILLERALSSRYDRIRDSETVRSHFFSPFTGFRAGGLLAFVSRGSPWAAKGGSQFEKFRDSAPWLRYNERDGIANKGVQHFLLVNGDRNVAILNTHLQAQYPTSGRDSAYREIRAGQIAQLRRLAERLSDNATPVVAAGDLNTMPDETDLYRAVTAYWTDLTRAKYDSCRCGTHLGKDLNDGSKVGGSRWMDYVLARMPSGYGDGVAGAKVELIESKTVDCRYSDHHGLDVLVPLARQ